GVDRDTPGGPMVENRTPGKTGRAGWMKESGFPVFKAEPAQESNEDGDGKKDRKRDKKGEKKAEKKG
ncbi:MAG TPA: hypothetical protein PKW66_25095, partial [Polyangiaceae bacterium]|nr:hypothetical protein [Polyangiaceae bacterium]